MRDDERAEVRQDLTQWGQSIIFDRVGQFYRERLPRRYELAAELAVCHHRMWRFLLGGHTGEAARLRLALLLAARQTGIADADVDALDHAVLDELMDVVVTRFRRSPVLARSYGMSLVDTATDLAFARIAAA